MARSLAPLPEESLPGFLLRLAFRLNRSPGRIAELCGIHDGRRGRLLPDHLLGLPEEAATEFARATCLSLAEVNALGLRRYADVYPALRAGRSPADAATARRRGAFFGSIRDVYSDRWVVTFSSRYCPACLRGDGDSVQDAYGGAWKLRWHLPVVFACTAHQQLLSSSCPGCASPQNRQVYKGRAALLALPTSTHQMHPLQCRNRIVDGGSHTRPCGARLDDATPYPYRDLPAADHARLLELQARLDHRLRVPPPHTRNIRNPKVLTFQDLVDTAQLIKLSWPAARDLVPSRTLAALIDDHIAPLQITSKSTPARTHSLFSPLWSAPQGSAECGALLLTAEALHLEAPDTTALRERIRPLAQYAFEHAPSGASRSFFSRPGLSPPLARAMARRLHGFYAAGPLEYANLRAPSRDCRFTADEVPPQIPQDWYDTYFTDFAEDVPGAGIYTVRHLRRAASLKLMEMTAGGSWRESARVLDIPESRALSTLNKLRCQFGGADLWPRFEHATDQLADYLDRLPQRTNYAHRRRFMANWTLPYEDWLALCSGLAQGDRLTSRHGAAIGTVMVWAEVTQAEYLLCPLLQRWRRSGTDAGPVIDEVSKCFTPANQRGGRLELRRRLHTYVHELSSRIDAGDALGSTDHGADARSLLTSLPPALRARDASHLLHRTPRGDGHGSDVRAPVGGVVRQGQLTAEQFGAVPPHHDRRGD
ncbi:TniQ family protein [Streptomyces sp. NBC_01478]|uniref:TniQ family protein n=1 Tax=Streptomyces sp. NBC_01478 TaxID=2903882 RepID=UPI002E3017D2|nr:TniQ family protein [Streptomyces sp. NBC_01478]